MFNSFIKGNELADALKVDVRVPLNTVSVKVKQSRYRPGVAQRVPGS
jgi:hypothetical protein